MSLTVLPQPKPRVTHEPYLMLGSLQVIDVMLTGTLLALFTQAAEGNPIARLLTDLGLPGLLVLLALKLGAVTLMWWTQSGVRLASAVYSLVAINNLLGLLVLVSL